jgi:glycosyltransferase involved in cell wall biosynthesis
MSANETQQGASVEKMTDGQPQVRIIVPTRNESRNLPQLLDSIRSQVGVTYELFVVDQESDDDTKQLAQEAGATVLNRPRPAFYSPPAESRNLGAEGARAPLLLHLDADMTLPDERFLQRFVALFDEQHQAAIIHEVDVAEGFWNRVKAAERACYWNTGIECARGVTNRLFKTVGGYNAAVSSGEDMQIHRMYAQHTTVAKSDDVWVQHRTGRLSLRRLLTKKYNYGKTAGAFLEQSRSTGGYSATGWVKEALLAYLTHPQVAVQNPLAFSCILPLRMAELVAVRLGMRNAGRNSGGR